MKQRDWLTDNSFWCSLTHARSHCLVHKCVRITHNTRLEIHSWRWIELTRTSLRVAEKKGFIHGSNLMIAFSLNLLKVLNQMSTAWRDSRIRYLEHLTLFCLYFSGFFFTIMSSGSKHLSFTAWLQSHVHLKACRAVTAHNNSPIDSKLWEHVAVWFLQLALWQLEWFIEDI